MIIYWVCLLLTIVLLRKFVFSSIEVRGESMHPTMVDGERVIALKISDIDRFDIVTFPAPDAKEKNYVKRVIGLPGDTVEYREDILYINGEAVEEPYLDESKAALTDGEPLTTDFTFNLLSEGYAVAPNSGLYTNTTFSGVTEVPEGKVFVLGDNRRNSKDSRMIGFIDEADIIGDVKFVFWPLNRFGLI
ncbi:MULTISPECIES: signal peptidase I [unclassified Enterococcus]|uniref:signal peptidase I n=1 Tax=unclassified Enterococcus TaxID=2608891 RepID=UPI0024757BD7|nr:MULTISPECIES: signal peptidase I [unclassified Enterococcus]